MQLFDGHGSVECGTRHRNGKPVVRRGRNANGSAMFQDGVDSRAAERPGSPAFCLQSLRSEAGLMAFVEYFIVAIVALLAAVAFFDGGRFQGARGRVEDAFQGLMRAACHNCEFDE